ncbi:MAG: hypothetical protein ABIP19_01140 [Dermatophilaceae bacterium]
MTAVSGITPSGHLTLGNYLGALRRFAEPTTEPGFYFVADLHAMTTRHDPRRLATLTRETALLVLASGVSSESVFIQSAVPAHARLAYLLECTAYVGELSRMVQYKEKGRDKPMTRASLFTYPCLMAADILLYGARRVPVGGHQDQHVELARDLAVRFNRKRSVRHLLCPSSNVPFCRGRARSTDPDVEDEQVRRSSRGSAHARHPECVAPQGDAGRHGLRVRGASR